VALVESLPSDGVTIAASRWPTLVAIGAGRSVGDLGQAMGMGELSVSRAVRDLVDLGVIGIEPPGPADVPPAPPTDDRRTALPRSDSPVRDVPPSRPDVAPREVARRGPFGNLGSGDTLGTAGAVHDGDAMTTAEMQRAGWLQSPERPSGSTPAVPDDGGPVVPDDLTPAPSNGANGTSGGAVSMTRPPAPPGASTSRFSGRSASPGKRPSPRPGASKRPPSTNGRSSTPGRRSSGPLGAGSGIGRERTSASSPELPSGGAPAEPRRGSTRPPVPPRRRGPRLTPPTFEPGGLSTPPPGFDSGPLMPAPPPADTGQIRPVSPASLPPDLHWAADDASGLGSSGLGSGPGNGLALGGPAVPPPVPIDPSKVAPHVAALSPEARAAVQATAGNSGGSTGPASGDDVADRGQLLNFLSSVRP
jgi:translation initiation factor IF-2